MVSYLLKAEKWFLAGLFVVFSATGQVNQFELFKTQLDEIESEQEQLIFITQTQPDLVDWPPQEQGRFHHQKGLVLEANDQIEAAKKAFTASINLFEQSGQPNTYWIQSLQDRSYMDYLLTNDPDSYCVDRQSAVNIARKTKLPEAIAGSLTFLAFCYQKGPDSFKKGLNILEEAAEIAQKNNLAVHLTAMIHNATGNLYRNNKIHDKSYEYYLKAYEQWATEQDKQDMFNMQHNLAGQSMELGLWDQADQHIKQLFVLTENSPDFGDFRFFAHFNQALSLYSQKKFKAAIDAFNSTLELAHTTSEQYFIDMARGSLAIAYFRDQQVNKADQTAKIYLQDSAGSQSLRQLSKQVSLIPIYAVGGYQESIDSMWELLDQTDQDRRAFIKNSVALQSVEFDQTISRFQEQALADQLTIKQLELEKKTKQNQINQLELDKQIKQNKINQLNLMISSLALLGLLVAFWLVYRSRKNYRDLSQTDPLTKVSNRRHILKLGKDLLDKSMELNTPFYLVIIDIDDFKQINDQFGHVMGDEVIKVVVNTIQHAMSPGHPIGRIGGEEFVLMLPEMSKDQVISELETVRKEVSQQKIKLNDQQVSVTISGGFAGGKHDKQTLQALMKQADTALYQAKASGKNIMLSGEENE